MSLPNSGQYSDINSDSTFTGTEFQEVQRFLEKCGSKVDSHVEKMYDERLLKFVRISNHQEYFYFKASCHAEMKRGLSYTIDICINQQGLVLETL